MKAGGGTPLTANRLVNGIAGLEAERGITLIVCEIAAREPMRLLAVLAQHADEPLSDDRAHARCEQKTFDLQVDEPWDGTGCGISMERRENEMPGQSRMHTDMRRFRIPHLAHHDHVRILSQE